MDDLFVEVQQTSADIYVCNVTRLHQQRQKIERLFLWTNVFAYMSNKCSLCKNILDKLNILLI